MPRSYTKRRAEGAPRADRLVATHLTAEEVVEVDRRAGAVGLSRSAFVRAVLLADAEVCAVLGARIAELEAQGAGLSARLAMREAQLAERAYRHERDVASLRGLLDLTSREAERRREAESWYFFGEGVGRAE
jgi:hypothetical protein